MDKKLFTKQQIISYIKDFVTYLTIKHKLKIQKLYLFGSYAKKNPRNWSDIDICIISADFTNNVDPLSYLWSKLRSVDVEHLIEPIGLHPKDFIDENPIAWEIKKYGIPINLKNFRINKNSEYDKET